MKEQIAKIICRYDGGIDRQSKDYELAIGGKLIFWEKLEEWERDDYRYQAEHVIKLLKKICDNCFYGKGTCQCRLIECNGLFGCKDFKAKEKKNNDDRPRSQLPLNKFSGLNSDV